MKTKTFLQITKYFIYRFPLSIYFILLTYIKANNLFVHTFNSFFSTELEDVLYKHTKKPWLNSTFTWAYMEYQKLGRTVGH